MARFNTVEDFSDFSTKASRKAKKAQKAANSVLREADNKSLQDALNPANRRPNPMDELKTIGQSQKPSRPRRTNQTAPIPARSEPIIPRAGTQQARQTAATTRTAMNNLASGKTATGAPRVGGVMNAIGRNKGKIGLGVAAAGALGGGAYALNRRNKAKQQKSRWRTW